MRSTTDAAIRRPFATVPTPPVRRAPERLRRDCCGDGDDGLERLGFADRDAHAVARERPHDEARGVEEAGDAVAPDDRVEGRRLAAAAVAVQHRVGSEKLRQRAGVGLAGLPRQVSPAGIVLPGST